MSEQTQYSEAQKNAYWFKVARHMPDVKKLLMMHRISGQLEHGSHNWRNVPEHCLVEVARVATLGHWLGLPEPIISEMKMGSFLHDDRKKQEILATRDAIERKTSPIKAARAEHKEADDLLKKNGFNERVRRLAGSAGGDVPQLVEVQRILDQETISDDDWAYLLVHYIDDCSIDAKWVLSSNKETGQNIVDYRMEENRKKKDYEIIAGEISAELFTLPKFKEMKDADEKMDNITIAVFLSHEIEKRIAKRIDDLTGISINPLEIPESIDKRIENEIATTV